MSCTRTPGAEKSATPGELIYRDVLPNQRWDRLERKTRAKYEDAARRFLSRFRACGACGGEQGDICFYYPGPDETVCAPCPECGGTGWAAKEGGMGHER